MPRKDPVRYVVGSVACGRFDPLLKRSLNRATVDFHSIYGVYLQVHEQLEALCTGLLGIDPDEIGTSRPRSREELDEEHAENVFMAELLPAFAKTYPEAVDVASLGITDLHKHPLLHKVIRKNGLSPSAQKHLWQRFIHVVLEEIAAPLTSVILRECETTLDDFDEVDVSQCIEQRIGRLLRLPMRIQAA